MDKTKLSKEKSISEKIKSTKSLWIIGGAVLALVVILIIVMVCINSNKAESGKKALACSAGTVEVLSEGEWVVGKDITSGNYRIESEDDSTYISLYRDGSSEYYKYFEVEDSSYLRLENGQKVEVGYGDVINMTCEDLGDLELLSLGKTMSAGSYTLVSANSSFYAYVYGNEKDSESNSGDYDTISIDSVGGTKDFRFKDGQYIEVDEGNVFLIDKNASNYDSLVSEAKKLAKALTGVNESVVVSSPSSSNSSSSSSSSNTSSSTNASFRKVMDDYESFMNKYVDFMKKYNNSSDTMSMLAEYSTMMQDYAKFAESISGYNQSNLSTADWTYYIEVTTRVNKKLLEV